MGALQLVDKITGEILESSPTFDDLWMLFPRRVAKRDAMKAWERLSSAQQLAAVVAAADWRRVWAGKDLQFVPHCSTWLNGWRFEDELPPEFTQSNAAHVAAQLPEPSARTVMPEHVKALLAKLRGGNAR
jgi:hypothetical protein